MIWFEFVPTAKSDIKVSSLSPDLWEITVLNPIKWANLITSSVSVTVPIWFNLIRIEFAELFKNPILINLPKDYKYDNLFLSCLTKKLFFLPYIYALILLHSFFFKLNLSPSLDMPPTSQKTLFKDFRTLMDEENLVDFESLIIVILLFL